MSKTAIDRASELMMVPFNDLPPLALQFAQRLIKRYGTCGEVYLTAYAIYAQEIENLPCDDDLCRTNNEYSQWFKEQKLNILG